MKVFRILVLFMGLSLLLGCTNTSTGNEERNPRENLEFFHNVQEDEAPERARVYYHGEHYFKD